MCLVKRVCCGTDAKECIMSRSVIFTKRNLVNIVSTMTF